MLFSISISLVWHLLFIVCILPSYTSSYHGQNNNKESSDQLKVCTQDGGVYYVSSNQCNKGAWLPQAITPSCICLSGLWALSKDYCSDDFYIFAGNNDCFQINAPIRRFISILGSGTRSQTTLAFSGDLSHWQEIGDKKTLTSFSSNELSATYVLRVNETDTQLYLRHNEGMEKRFWQRCIQPQRQSNTFQIIKTNGLSFADNKEGCEKWLDPSHPVVIKEHSIWGLMSGQSWHPKHGLQSASAQCKRQCYPAKKHASRSISSTNTNQLLESEKSKNQTEELNKLLHHEASRTTNKIAFHLKEWLLKRIAGPKVSYKEFRYLKFARLIFLKTCPNVDIPAKLLTNFFQLFRYLIHETALIRPDLYSSDTGDVVHNNILDALDSCLNFVEPMKLEYRDTCRKEIDNIEYKGMTYENITLPMGMAFHVNSTDVMVETAWKLIMHTYYLCSDFFNEQPTDLSVMFMKLQEFFTFPAILYRWENPGENLNKIYSFLFADLNLEKFTAAIDACVAVSHASSSFVEWIGRPKYDILSFAENNMEREHVLLGQREINPLNGSSGIQNVSTVFSGKGYCVSDFNDPLKWSEFNPEVNAVC